MTAETTRPAREEDSARRQEIAMPAAMPDPIPDQDYRLLELLKRVQADVTWIRYQRAGEPRIEVLRTMLVEATLELVELDPEGRHQVLSDQAADACVF